MENTIENKEKFFALYWGQRVISYPKENGGFRIVEGHNCNEKTFLQLKPLSEISELQLSKLAEMCNIMIGSHEKDSFKDLQDFKRFLVNEKDLFLNSNGFDYLRSEGFLINFHSLTPDQIIEYGWVKF